MFRSLYYSRAKLTICTQCQASRLTARTVSSIETKPKRIYPRNLNSPEQSADEYKLPPKRRRDWPHLPNWRRQSLSVKHKIAQQPSFQRHPQLAQSYKSEESQDKNVPQPVPYWQPRKKVSPDAMVGMRNLHAYDNVQFSVAALAESFKLSPEAVRRILKSKWVPNEEEAQRREERWKKRGRQVVEKYKERVLLEKEMEIAGQA